VEGSDLRIPKDVRVSNPLHYRSANLPFSELGYAQ
jgi:hypothetical protein